MYKKGIDQGENGIYFQINGDEISGRLKFDPGAKVGEYVLHSVEVRTI